MSNAYLRRFQKPNRKNHLTYKSMQACLVSPMGWRLKRQVFLTKAKSSLAKWRALNKSPPNWDWTCMSTSQTSGNLWMKHSENIMPLEVVKVNRSTKNRLTKPLKQARPKMRPWTNKCLSCLLDRYLKLHLMTFWWKNLSRNLEISRFWPSSTLSKISIS